MTSTDHPRIIAPPPLLYLAAVIAAVVLHWYWPIALMEPVAATWLALSVVLVGLAVNVWGAFTMRRVRTAINPYQPTSHIVDTGPFRWTRNPLYLGMDLLFVGISLWLNSLWCAPVFVVLLLVMHYGVILREERYLEGRFDEAYRRYCARVRRYI
jgi:protein-S-isoprenylcysteine O-methyltransferase Ste14